MDLLYTAHVPPGRGPHPTIVAIHGWGANAHDLLGLAPALHGGNALVLCPQGPVSVAVGPSMQGFGWFQLTPGMPPNPIEFAQGSTRLSAFIDQALERYPIDPEHLIVLGFSQGGVMAYDLALRQPQRFKALAALSSWMPPKLAESLPTLPAAKGLPVLMVHGTEDPMIDIVRARESRELLRRFEVDLSYREFPMGHEIKPQALQVIREWLEALL